VFIKGAQMGAPLGIDTPIPTPDGLARMIDLKVGSRVYGSDGKLYNVTYVSPVFEDKECYEIKAHPRWNIITASSDHLWQIQLVKKFGMICDTYALYTGQFGAPNAKKRSFYRVAPISAPTVQTYFKPLPVHPYFLGLWLSAGDGYDSSLSLFRHIMDEVKEKLQRYSLEFRIEDEYFHKYHSTLLLDDYHKEWVRKHDLIYDMYIPAMYLGASYADRKLLLEGMCDAAGYPINNVANNFHLAMNFFRGRLYRDATYLLKSMAHRIRAYRHTDRKASEKGLLCNLPSYMQLDASDLDLIPSRITRIYKKSCKNMAFTPLSDIVHVGKRPTICIGVDSPDHLYCITEAFIPTHNTEMLSVLKPIHGSFWGKYKQDIMVFFPSLKESSEFTKGRFDPVLEANKTLLKQALGKTDSASVKQIGKNYLYFRGTRGKNIGDSEEISSSAAKSVPCDSIIFDEYDEMEMSIVELARQRILESDFKLETYLSTPTIPGYGIDDLYSKTDQRTWWIPCPHCSISTPGVPVTAQHTCLELTFPQCLKRDKENIVYRVCSHCGGRLDLSAGGIWVPQSPSVTDKVGWWISRLSSVRGDVQGIMDMYEDPMADLRNLYNSLLGKPYIGQTEALTTADVISKCTLYNSPGAFHGPAAAGIDVSPKRLHVIIGCRTGRTNYQIIKVCRILKTATNDIFEEAAMILTRYGVKTFVIDKQPETSSARGLIKKLTKEMSGWLCEYHDELKRDIIWNKASVEVQVNKTEISDRSHNLFAGTGSGFVEIYRADDEIKEHFAPEMVKLVSYLHKGKKYYRAIGDDHYRNAMNYFLLAVDRVAVIDRQAQPSSVETRQRGKNDTQYTYAG
jgi:hypothetical protein